MHLYICVWLCVFVQDPRDQPRREGSCKLPVKAVGNDLFLVDIDKRANLWWRTPLFLKSWLRCTRQLEGRDCANMQCVFVALFGKDFIQLVLITGPVFDIKQVSPSLEIGCVSHKFTSFVEFWKIKSIPDKAQNKYFTLIGGDGKGGVSSRLYNPFHILWVYTSLDKMLNWEIMSLEGHSLNYSEKLQQDQRIRMWDCEEAHRDKKYFTFPWRCTEYALLSVVLSDVSLYGVGRKNEYVHILMFELAWKNTFSKYFYFVLMIWQLLQHSVLLTKTCVLGRDLLINISLIGSIYSECPYV